MQTHTPVYLACVETKVMLDTFLEPLGLVITAKGERRPGGDKERRNEGKARKAGANKQTKLGKALC